jgi:predicted NAD/FAD-binding protein
MTFGISRDQGLLEWAGTSFSAIFAQRENLYNPGMWRMIFDIIRFNQFALDLLHEEDESEINPMRQNGSMSKTEEPRHQESIGSYLEREAYSDSFRDDYLIPMTAAVWSTSPDKASLEFPAVTLVRFLWNHHLLSTISARPSWMTIMNGSKQYIDAVMADFPQDRVHIGIGIESLKVQPNGQITLKRVDGNEDIYDHVILATHGDQALQIIRPIATIEEKEIMSKFKTSTNTAVLHSDLSVGQIIVLASFLLTPLADAYPSHCLVIMELHHHITLARKSPIGLSDLLDESAPAYSNIKVRSYPGDP